MEGATFEQATLSLQELTQENVDLLEPIASVKDITLSNNITTSTAFADRNMTDTVIRNLLTNAVKFTPSGGTVEVSSADHGHMVQVTVSDTGVGMSKEQADEVFALDQKTSTIGTAGENGTGLGLPLCKEMIERNGGRIWVDSTPREGSRFHFTLSTGQNE